MNTIEARVGRSLCGDALKPKTKASRSRAETFEKAGLIPEAKSAYEEYITCYNKLLPEQQKEGVVSEMYRLSMEQVNNLPGNK